MAQIRSLMLASDPGMTEEWKWLGSPTWSRDGVVAIEGPMQEKVKLTFSRGSLLPDPWKVFYSGLGGKEWRAMDISKMDMIDGLALEEVIKAAVLFNQSQAKDRTAQSRRHRARRFQNSQGTRSD